MDFNETFRNRSVDVTPQLISFWSPDSSRWPPQLIEHQPKQNGYNSASVRHAELKLGVVVAESQPQQTTRFETS